MERRKTIKLPIGYTEGCIYFLEDALVSVIDIDGGRILRLDMIYDKFYTVNNTEEVREVLKQIGYIITN